MACACNESSAAGRRVNVGHIIAACSICPRAVLDEHDIVHGCQRIRNAAGAVCPRAYWAARLDPQRHCPEGKW